MLIAVAVGLDGAAEIVCVRCTPGCSGLMRGTYASLQTLVGTSTEDGGCSFSVPELGLPPGGTSVEARQVETNFTDCTTTIEVGTPLEDEKTLTDGTAEAQVAEPVEGTKQVDDQSAVAAVSSSGYYRV